MLLLLHLGHLGVYFLGSCPQILLILLVEFFLEVYFLPQMFCLLTEVLVLSVEFADVLIDEVVLLLVLQKGGSDALQFVGPTLLFNFLEALPDSLHRFAVAFDDLHLFLVLGNQVPEPVPDQGQGISPFVFGLVLYPAFEDVVASLAAAHILICVADLCPEHLGFRLILSLDVEDATLILLDEFLAAVYFILLLGDLLVAVLDAAGDFCHDFLLVELLLAEFVDLCLELLVGGEDLVVGVDGLVHFVLQDPDLALHLDHFGAKLPVLQEVEFLGLFGVLLDDLVAVLLDPEELALVLFEQFGVIIDLPFEDLVGGFTQQRSVVERLVDYRGFFQFLSLIHLLLFIQHPTDLEGNTTPTNRHHSNNRQIKNDKSTGTV